MAIPTTQEALRRWKTNTTNSTESYKAGVQAVTSSPTEAAAAAKDKWAAGVAAARDNGSYENGLRSVSLTDWKKAAAEKGATRIAEGVKQAEGKMGAFLSAWLPHQAAGQASVKSMPSTTREERKQRMLRMFEHNSNFRS